MKQMTSICYGILLTITAAPQWLHAQSTDTLTLSKKPDSLKAVTVTGRKQFIEQRIDRTIINVRNSATAAGGTALEVLERSPGVIINRQSNTISMAGREGVMVMINGKMTYMPMTALLQMLQGMNAANIERIELITTPPSNLDAEGNAGYINIVLIDNPYMGLNGTYSLTMGYGRGEAPAANGSFNYRHARINLYGEYSFSRLRAKQYLYNFRQVNNAGDIAATTTETWRDPVQQNHNARLGLDWQMSKKTLVGILASGYDNRWTMDAINRAQIDKNNVTDTMVHLTTDEVNHWKHFMSNLNITHQLNSRQTITVNTNYLYYLDNNPTSYTNEFFKGDNSFLFRELTTSDKETPINLWVGSIDYSIRLSKKFQLETGIKGVRSRFENEIRVQSFDQGNWLTDTSLSARYFLKEQIGAVYASGSLTLNKSTSIKAGLRYEYTESNLGTATKQNIVDRKYGKLFPSVFITRKLGKAQSLGIAYSKRITRPTFNDLAPFVIFLDPSTFFSGNSALQPSLTDIVKADYSYNKYIVSLSYSYEADAITGFQSEVDVASNKQFFKPQNLRNRKTLSLSISLPVDITNWWSMQNNVIGNWQQVNSDYHQKPLQREQSNLNFSTTWRFTLPAAMTAELSGFYQSRSLSGIAVNKSYGSLNAGWQKKFKHSSLSITGNNMLNTNISRLTTDMPDHHFFVYSRFERIRPLYRITFTHTLGNRVLQDKRNRSTGSEEEGGRIR